ncbi:MAG TPA: hypothetical protein VME01_02835, partial [Solirubrobacteraceae bacterium]|nr:hypothetical protein [Solirubrobacteraceae bacterium]
MGAPVSLRRILACALAALTAGVGILSLVLGWSPTPAVKAVQVLTVIGLGAIIIGGVIILSLVYLADWRTPEEDFEVIVRRAEQLAAEQSWGYGEEYG